MKHIKILFPLSIFIIILCLLVSPERYSVVALNGVLVWATILLPTLFPFMFFSRLFSSFDFIESLSRKIDKLTKKIFNIPGDGVYIYLLSILCGYPIGAKLTHDLFFDGRINSGEATKIMALASNCGPMFIIGSVAIGMLHSKLAGLIIYFCHIISSLINGLIYRKTHIGDNNRLPLKTVEKKQSISDLTFSSINSILLVGAYVIIFFIISQICIDVKLFYPINILGECFGIEANITNSLLFGMLEITKGVQSLSMLNLELVILVPLMTFIITFGGFSTFMQSYAFLEKIGIKKRTLLLQKTTQSLIATALGIIASLLIL